MTRRRYSISLAACMLIVGLSCDKEQAREAAPRTPAQPTAKPTRPSELVTSGRLYVPIYSHIYVQKGHAADLAVTVSVRNVSMHRSLVLESVRYYDTSGKLLEDFLDGEATLQPLETVEFFVATEDQRGGSGANVVATWHSDSLVTKPLVEAIMVYSQGSNQAYAFSTRAIEIPADSPAPNEGGVVDKPSE